MTDKERDRREARRRLADLLADELEAHGQLDSERLRARIDRTLRGLELTRWERTSALDDAARSVRGALDRRRQREARERALQPARVAAARQVQVRTQQGGSRIIAC